MKNVLVILNSYDSFKQAIVEMSNEEYEMFSKANNHEINVDEYDEVKNDLVTAIDSAFYEGTSDLDDDTPELSKKYRGKWVKLMCDISDLSNVDNFIHVGFF